MKDYYKFCKYIKEYYARKEGKDSGENFGSFIVSTGVLNINILSLLGVVGFFIPSEVHVKNNILIATSTFLTVATFNYLLVFKNNKYLKATEDEEPLNGRIVLTYLFISLLFMILVIVINREFIIKI